jgi:hypothetical protein
MTDETPDLGIPLLKPRMGVEHQVGCRYWVITEEGYLDAPLWSGSIWKPGLNRGITSGLYCFHYEPGLDQTGYFTLSNCHYHNAKSNDHVIGGIAYWVPQTPAAAGAIVNAKYAAVACLIMPNYASRSLKKRIKRASEYYQVEVVDYTQLKDTVDAYVDGRLPSFYEPALLPLSELTSLATSIPLPHETRWSLAPRTHRPRPGARGASTANQIGF